jgi:hypothetical protein
VVETFWKWLIGLPTYADFWNAFWASVFGATAGAFAAFTLERRRRKAERVRDEIGKCYTLHFFVMHMASVLLDFQGHLFGGEGNAPRGSLEGAPQRGADFETKDYAFLLDGTSKNPEALALLNKIYLATVNFNSTLARLHTRNRLWGELLERRPGATFATGQTAIDRIGQYQAIEARVTELTEWLRFDFHETIEELEAIQPMLQRVFTARYPKVPFIVSARREAAPPA